jgi:predicted Fe-Mo cluster-binding NifX family protein
MKVAVAIVDEATISQHFGRSTGWLIYDVKDGEVTPSENRPNTHSHHAAHGCHDKVGQSEPHSHRRILEALEGCRVVIAGGLGWRAAEDLKSNGITPLLVDHHRTPVEAVEMYAAGKLEEAGQKFCGGRHASS